MRTPISLFAYLLRAQTLVSVSLVLALALLFAVERNRTVAELAAQALAPALLAEQGQATGRALQQPLQRATQLPQGAVLAGDWSPRLQALRQTLAQHGVDVQALAFSKGAGQAVLWLQVADRHGTPHWLAFSDRVLEPLFLQRMAAALVLFLLCVLGVSAWLAWRIAQPLKRLAASMHSVTEQSWAAGLRPVANGGDAPALAETQLMEDAFARLCAQREQLESERHLLLAGVSHDLRSPLARIRIAAELLPDLGAGIPSKRQSIVQNVQVCDRLIDSFLDYVRLGHLVTDQRVDANAVAQETVAAFERAPQDLQLLADGPFWLEASNPVLLERLLFNLIDNALKHGATPVQVRLEQDAQGRLTLSVSDAGPGLAVPDPAQLLRAFARGPQQRNTPGTGLGLTVALQAAQRLGAKLEFGQRDACHCATVRWL